MGKKQRRWNFEREDKRENKEKQTQWEEEKDLKDKPFGGTKKENL